MVVYLIECLVTGKRYVGKTTKTSHSRWREHKTEARIYRKTTPLIEAIREHGSKNFTVTDLGKCEYQRRLNAMERRFIKQYESDNPEKGYNLAPAGSGGKKKKLKRTPGMGLTEQHRERIRASVIAFHVERRANVGSEAPF